VRLALGTVQFGLPYGIANQTGQVARSEARAMLQLAARSGIDTLDTAIAYGESETCLGEAGVQAFKVVTKLPAIPSSCPNVAVWVREQVGVSLGRLGLPSINGLLLHRSADLLGKDGATLWHALESIRSEGLVQKVGVSVYSPSEIEAVTELYKIDLVQAPFNLVDRRLSTSGWLNRLKSAGVEVHTRSAFLQGLLLMPASSLPQEFSRWRELFTRWHQWLSVSGVSALQACLSFSLGHPQVDRVVVGADGLQQLQQIVDLSNRAMTSALPDLGSDDEMLINPARWAEVRSST
jgi:aryl-alcohol dehydrogenase-like predicted oxidoreductase